MSAHKLTMPLTVLGRGEPMPTGAEVLGDGPIGGEKALGMPGRFEPLHAPLPLARGLVRILGTVIEVFVLAVFHARQNLPLGSSITLELIRNEHPGDILAPFKEFAEELLGGVLVAPPLHEDVEFHAVLIHGPPQIVPLRIDSDDDLI